MKETHKDVANCKRKSSEDSENESLSVKKQKCTLKEATDEGIDPPPKKPCVLVFSGKRKSGKDYVTDILQERLVLEQGTLMS